MVTPEEVLGLLKEWKNASGPWRQRGMENRDVYNGDFSVPLPELDENERVAVANLLQQGLDQIALRATSTAPRAVFFPDRIGFDIHEQAARERRACVTEWWRVNRVQSKRRRRARWLFGYGKAPVALYPGPDGLARWRLLDPLHTYEAPCLDPDDMTPPALVYDYKRSREWLRREYPDQYHRLRKADETTTFELVEYNSGEEIMLFVVATGTPAYDQGTPYEILHYYVNRTGRPWCVVPGRIGLDKVLGQFDGLVGMYQLQAKLMALYTIGVQRGVFGETWLQGTDPLRPARIVTHADGKRGRIGHVEGGSIQQILPAVGALTPSLLDRIEYGERQEGGVPPEFGGASGSNIRTGRRGDSVLSAAIDYRIQESQEILGLSQEVEDEIAIAIAKTYAGSKTFSFYSKGLGTIEYTPNKLFTSTLHEVRYPYAGADANTLDVRIAQKIGTEVMSRRTGIELDPQIDDAELELDRIESEKIKNAFMQSIMTMVADPNSPLLPSDLAKMTALVERDRMEIYEAFETVHNEAQQRQAQAAQPDPMAAMGGMGPEGQPGLDADMAQRLATIQGPSPSMANLNFLLGNIRNSAQPVGGP